MATELPILACSLDAQGAREQAARYAKVAAHVTELTRTDHSLSALVDAGIDQQLVKELVDTERACCPFFEIGWDRGRLSFSVAHAEHAPALGVIHEALAR